MSVTDAASDEGGRIAAAARLLSEDRALAVTLGVLLFLVLLAVLGPIFWRQDPTGIQLGATLMPPSWAHPMGTDSLGRDVFARFLAGARISLAIGTIVVLVGATIGGTIGLMAAFSGSGMETALMRTMDAILAFPSLILAMAIALGLGASLRSGAIGITVASIPWYARVVRSEALKVRAMPYIESTVAIGATRKRVLWRHIAPHVLPTLLIQGAASFGYAVLALAALGFIGLGAQVPTPEWGAMITDGLQYTLTGQWWVGVFPGLGLLVAVTAANLLADRARDHLDPKGAYARI